MEDRVPKGLHIECKGAKLQLLDIQTLSKNSCSLSYGTEYPKEKLIQLGSLGPVAYGLYYPFPIQCAKYIQCFIKSSNLKQKYKSYLLCNLKISKAS